MDFEVLDQLDERMKFPSKVEKEREKKRKKKEKERREKVEIWLDFIFLWEYSWISEISSCLVGKVNI